MTIANSASDWPLCDDLCHLPAVELTDHTPVALQTRGGGPSSANVCRRTYYEHLSPGLAATTPIYLLLRKVV